MSTSGIAVADDTVLDALDQGREENTYFEGLDDFIQDLEGKSVMKIKTLEKTLESEKRRLATMEMALTEARKQKQSEQRMQVVSKQSTMLKGMMEVLKTMTSREIEAKQEWDNQWREKFADFRQQHLDMEAALKRRHVNELKALQDDIRDEVRALAHQAKESQGKSMPSPRTVKTIQDKNMQRVVFLFHQHAQERLHLASKISQQEELLIRAKNRSLQEKISQVQTKSNRVCGKLHSSGLQQIKRLQIEAGDEGSGDMDGGSPSSKKAIRLSGMAPEPQVSHRGDHRTDATNGNQLSHSSMSTSPGAFQVGTSTFVTEIDYEQEPATRRSHNIRSHPTWTAKSKGSQSYDHDQTNNEVRDIHSHRSPADDTPIGMNTMSFPHRQPDAPTTSAFPQQVKGSAFGVPGMQPDYSGTKFPGQEFLPWAHPTTSILKDEGKPVWNSHPCKWNPNVIAIESSVIASNKSAFSPYATFAIGERPSEKRQPGKGASGSARNYKKAKGTQKDPFRSASARSFPQPRNSQSTTRSDLRSVSTEPRLENVKARKSTPDSGRGKTTLPQIADKNIRQQSTDPNFNRPKIDNGAGDEFPSAAEKYSKLESWIEDKIRDVLGHSSTKSAILASQLASSALSHLQQSSEGEDEEQREDSRRTSFDRTGSSVGMRDVDSRGVRELDSRGHVLSMQPRSHSQAASAHRGAEPAQPATRTADGNVGSFMSRLRSGLAGEADLNASNQGLRVESRAGSEPAAAATAASINAALNPVKARDKREVRQGAEDDDEDAGGGGKPGESQELLDRRERFDRISSSSSLRASRDAGRAGGAQPKGAKRVGWNISPRESEADVGSEVGTDGRLGTSTTAGDLSRPGTRTSSRPDTSSSSFIGEDGDDDDDAERVGPAASSGDDRAGPELDIKDFFSKVRHNKVAECEEMIQNGVRMDVRDRHGNTPFLVAAQNGHKRLVKMFLREGADINATNHLGNTALHFTTSYGYQSLANYLMSKGADDTLMNMKGLTCYDGLG